MQTYVALLRGINVGGNRKVEMAKLKKTFEELGFLNVKTFIASGNVIFRSTDKGVERLTIKIERAIEEDFGFSVSVLLRTLPDIKRLVAAIPKDWVNDKITKCDVMFLWPAYDKRTVLNEFPTNPDIEQIMYSPGAVIWRIERAHATKSKLIRRVVGGDLYKQMTVRNPNSVRKIYDLMLEANTNP